MSMDSLPQLFVEGHPVEIIAGGKTPLVKTLDGASIHTKNAFGATGYSDMGWVALDKLESVAISDGCLACPFDRQNCAVCEGASVLPEALKITESRKR